jgi:hypothetical protein
MKQSKSTSIKSNHLERGFQKLYNRKIGAETAANILGTNPKTAYKYYKKFSNQFKIITVKNMDTDGINMIKQRSASLDVILLELWDSIDKINMQIDQKSDKPAPLYLQNQKLSFLKEIRNTINDKASLESEIPINESIDEMIEKIISSQGGSKQS